MVEYEGIRVGDRFNCYDDGKVRVSRQNVVTITNILPRSQWFPTLRKAVAQTKEDCDWLFDKVNHQVCITGITDDGEHCKFLKTQGNYWFTMDEWGPGLLDVTGNLTKNLINSLINGDYDYDKEQVDYFIRQLTKREICQEINEIKAIVNTLKGK